MFKSLIGKNLVSDNERKNVLSELSDSLKRQIVFTEVDMRTLEREKLKGGDQVQIEKVIGACKETIRMFEAKLEVVNDFLNNK